MRKCPLRPVYQKDNTEKVATVLKGQEEPVEQSKGQRSSQKVSLEPSVLLSRLLGCGGGERGQGDKPPFLPFPQFFAPRTALGTVRMLTVEFLSEYLGQDTNWY